jgi:hypothetical protein
MATDISRIAGPRWPRYAIHPTIGTVMAVAITSSSISGWLSHRRFVPSHPELLPGLHDTMPTSM